MLQVRLLEGVAAEREGERLTLPPPAGRLLALLALRPGARDREAVAAALWPDAAGPAVRANLRTAMWAQRQTVFAEAGTDRRKEITMTIDQDKLGEFLGRFVADLGATMAAGSVVVGHRLGLYRSLAEGPATADELAGRFRRAAETPFNAVYEARP